MKLIDDATAAQALENFRSTCDATQSALTELGSGNGDPAPHIHAIRKLGKSLRGACVLFALDPTAEREIQAVGRALANLRDAKSRMKTWAQLEFPDDAPAREAIAQMLEAEMRSADARPPVAMITWCRERIAIAATAADALPPETLGKVASNGLEALRKRVVKHCRGLNHRDVEQFHETRKAIKAYLGAISFLPDSSGITADNAFHQLAEDLGDENDLATLGAWLKSRGFTAEIAPIVWTTLRANRRAKQKSIPVDASTVVRAVKKSKRSHKDRTANKAEQSTAATAQTADEG